MTDGATGKDKEKVLTPSWTLKCRKGVEKDFVREEKLLSGEREPHSSILLKVVEGNL